MPTPVLHTPLQSIASLPEEQRYRLLVGTVTDYAIFMLDADGIVTSWNPGAERFKGYVAAEIIGRRFSALYTPEDRQAGAPERALAKARDHRPAFPDLLPPRRPRARRPGQGAAAGAAERPLRKRRPARPQGRLELLGQRRAGRGAR